METLSRRRALALLAGLSGIAVLPGYLRTAAAASLPGPLADLTEGLDVEAAARLGREYLDRYRENRDIERLLDELMQDSEESSDLPAFLSRKVRSDFAEGRVVEVQDWQISETEARIFAAIDLTS